MKVLLVGNYLPDQQQSMQRFAELLHNGLHQSGCRVRLIRPQPVWSHLKVSGARKWLGYADKLLHFPAQLRREAAWADVVHVCDHSNAFYIPYLQGTSYLVTCHDLGAVRGALGEETDCPASPTGKILQRWILEGLLRSNMVACDSTCTMTDLMRLGRGNFDAKRIRLVLLGLNHQYRQLTVEEAIIRLTQVGLDLARPFVLHVGSSLKRKNRDGVLRIAARLRHWPGQFVFAGDPLNKELLDLAGRLGVRERIVQIINPDNDTLEALYNRAHALLFPSRFEGFGWPVIEAQACGCPVLTSDRTSLPEVAGEGAIVRAVDDEAGFAADILRLMDEHAWRAEWIARGLANVRRFAPQTMISRYLDLYRELHAQP